MFICGCVYMKGTGGDGGGGGGGVMCECSVRVQCFLFHIQSIVIWFIIFFYIISILKNVKNTQQFLYNYSLICLFLNFIRYIKTKFTSDYWSKPSKLTAQFLRLLNDMTFY